MTPFRTSPIVFYDYGQVPPVNSGRVRPGLASASLGVPRSVLRCGQTLFSYLFSSGLRHRRVALIHLIICKVWASRGAKAGLEFNLQQGVDNDD